MIVLYNFIHYIYSLYQIHLCIGTFSWKNNYKHYIFNFFNIYFNFDIIDMIKRVLNYVYDNNKQQMYLCVLGRNMKPLMYRLFFYWQNLHFIRIS